MKEKKLKVYVLMLSSVFPATHPKAGQPTNFKVNFENKNKLHTIRNNYRLWEKRIYEVNKGEAIISVREWTGQPYKSKQRLIKNLGQDEVRIQSIVFLACDKKSFLINLENAHNYRLADISFNDWLSQSEFIDWFGGVDKLFNNETRAIIHFTDFKYKVNPPIL